MDIVSMSYLFPSQDIKQNVPLSFYLDNCLCHKINLQSFSKAMVDRKEKREGRKYKNWNISRTKRAFWMK